MAVINPSIASANPLAILDSLRRLGRAPSLHVDIEDGNFVPNITFGLSTIRELARHARMKLDAHILAWNPESYIAPLASFGFDALAIHYEAVPYPLDALSRIRAGGMRAGLALNLKTAADALEPFVEALDFAIVMTGEPDGEGQRFRTASLDKISRLRRLLPSTVEVWADGGVGEEQLPLVISAGADVVVMGRAVWRNGDPADNFRRLSAVATSAGRRREDDKDRGSENVSNAKEGTTHA